MVRGMARGGARGRGGAKRARGSEWDVPPPPRWEGSGRLAPAGEHVYGTHPVAAALARFLSSSSEDGGGRAEVHALYVQDGLETERGALADAARAAGAEVFEGVEKHDLNVMAGQRPHNGVVLDAAPLDPPFATALEPWKEQGDAPTAPPPPPLWVVLDQVTDPQNLGAVMRSAYFFGATGVVVASKNCAPLSPAASKASSGAMELARLVSCASLPRFLRRTREDAEAAGAPPWAVVGLSAAAADGGDPRGVELPAGAAALCAAAARQPTVVCVGSEGSGLRALVERECTALAHIAGAPSALVESLNASNAAATLLYQLSAARRPPGVDQVGARL